MDISWAIYTASLCESYDSLVMGFLKLDFCKTFWPFQLGLRDHKEWRIRHLNLGTFCGTPFSFPLSIQNCFIGVYLCLFFFWYPLPFTSFLLWLVLFFCEIWWKTVPYFVYLLSSQLCELWSYPTPAFCSGLVPLQKAPEQSLKHFSWTLHLWLHCTTVLKTRAAHSNQDMDVYDFVQWQNYSTVFISLLNYTFLAFMTATVNWAKIAKDFK